MRGESTRDRIVTAADRLFYEQGFESTSFADIAAAVKLSRGNFYYHFRTKDEILDAVIDRRMEETRAMLDGWRLAGADPAARIRGFIEMLVANRVDIMAFGCPVGTLCAELAKLEHPGRDRSNRIFGLFRDWLRDRFEELGAGSEADRLALHFLSLSQGVASLANAFRDEAFIRSEVDAMLGLLDTLFPERPAHPGPGA